MKREFALILNQNEILALGEVDAIHMDHERNERSFTGTGILPIFRGFYKEMNGKTEKVAIKEVEQKIVQTLIDKGEIEPKGWRVDWRPNHKFSDFDDDGYAHSIYSVELKISQSKFVAL